MWELSGNYKKESNGPTKHEKYKSQEEKTSLGRNKCILDTAEEKKLKP